MEDERAVELVSAHADELIGRPEARQQIAMTDEESRQITPLFQIAERLHQTMQPIQPSAAFVHSLGKELVDNARRQAGLSRRLRRAVLIGAAAVGSLLSIASVVGAIIFVIVRWRERAHTSTAQAPTG
jgi:hypothetical protein